MNNITHFQMQLYCVKTDQAELTLMEMSLDLRVFRHNRNRHNQIFDPTEP